MEKPGQGPPHPEIFVKDEVKSPLRRVVEDFITNKVSGIVLAPLDDTALRTPVSEAVKQGIPVVIIDSGLKSEDYVSFVATDNFKGGEMAGKRMVELLKGKGKVIMMRDGKDHTKEDWVTLSGTKVREMLSKGIAPPPEFSRPEVAKILMEYYQSTLA